MKAIFILGLLLFGNILHTIDRNVMSLFMPVVRDEMMLSMRDGGLILSSFVFVLAVIALPIARFADTHGPRVVIVGALFVWSAATYLCGSADGFITLFGFRMSVGAGEAGFPPAALAALALLFPPHQLGRAIAVFTLGASLGQVLGFTLSGQAEAALGWRGAFHLLGAVGVGLAAVIWLVWPHCVPKYKPAVNTKNRPGFFKTFLFLFTIPGYTTILVAAVVHAISAYAVYQWMPTFLHDYHDMPIEDVGTYMGLVLSVAGVAGAVVTGFVIDRIPLESKLSRCMYYSSISVALTVPFYLGPLLLDDFISRHVLIVAWFLSSVYYAPTYFVLQSMVPVENRASANAVVLTSFTVAGLGLGPVMVGGISDFLAGLNVDTSLAWAMAVGASLNLVAGAFFFITSKRLKASPPNWEAAAPA
jgi:predicted MFS family arabinose efflux permease